MKSHGMQLEDPTSEAETCLLAQDLQDAYSLLARLGHSLLGSEQGVHTQIEDDQFDEAIQLGKRAVDLGLELAARESAAVAREKILRDACQKIADHQQRNMFLSSSDASLMIAVAHGALAKSSPPEVAV